MAAGPPQDATDPVMLRALESHASRGRGPPNPQSLPRMRVNIKMRPNFTTEFFARGAAVAKPDTDDGWIKKACELEAALDFADFPKYSRIVLRYVFAQLFGRGHRPDHAIISSEEIAKRIGRSRKLVHRGLAQLVASGVLVPVEGVANGFRFIKDYEAWVHAERRPNSDAFTPTSRPLLTPDEVADCVGSIEYARSFAIHATRNPVPQRGSPPSPNEGHGSEASVPQRVPSCPPTGGPSVPQPGDQIVPPPVPPLLGTDLQSIQKEEEPGFRLAADAVVPHRGLSPEPKQGRLRLAAIPPTADTDDDLSRWVRGMILGGTRSRPRPDGNAELAQRVVDIAAGWRGLNYPESAIRNALQAAVKKGLVRQFVALKRYAEAILDNWASENRPGLPRANAAPVRAPVAYHFADDDRPTPPPRRPNPHTVTELT